MHYDRQGQPIELPAWAALIDGDPAYRIVRKHWCRGWLVSTVWLGLDCSFGAFPSPGGPLIFETMIFGPEGNPLSTWCTRSPTEDIALDVHWQGIAEVTRQTGVLLEDVTGCAPGSYDPSRIASLETSGEGYSRGGLPTATDADVEDLLGIRPLPLEDRQEREQALWPDAMRWAPGLEDSL